MRRYTLILSTLLILILLTPIATMHLSKSSQIIDMTVTEEKNPRGENSKHSDIIGVHVNEKIPMDLDKTLKVSFYLRFKLLSDGESIGAISPISNTKIMPVGGYLVPVNITVIKLPYEARNIKVDVEPISEKHIYLQNMDYPPIPVATISSNPLIIRPHQKVRFPLYDVEILRGIDPGTLERTTYLVLRIFPLKVLGLNEAKVYEEIRVGIRYTLERSRVAKAKQAEIDALILTSKELFVAAEELVDIKKAEGLRAMVMFVEDIYDDFGGRDLPEKIRNCIISMVENYNIKFVIILGDTDVVPAREVYIPDGAFDDNPEIDGKFVETDLYYADLQYSWDDNGDGLWGDLRNDKVDGVPDVIVGRLPVSNLTEALGVIEKIARYEPILPLYGSVLFAGTDTFQIGYPEGEYLLEFSEAYIRNMTIVKLYETLGNLTRSSFKTEFDRGHYLIAFTGHGLPDRVALTFSQTYTMGDAFAQRNWVYPVFIALSCDAGRFKDVDGLGEALVLNPNGGAIAFIGSTRIAWGYIGELVTTGLMGEMLWRTIKNIFNETLQEDLGRVWAQTLREYVMEHPIKNVLAGYYLDWKTVAEYNLLGDPTLSIRPKVFDNVTYTNIEINNGGIVIANKTIVVDRFVCNDASISIENSIVILNGTAMVNNSNLTLKNSILMGDIYMYLMRTNITATDSLITIKLVLTNSSLTAQSMVLDTVSSNMYSDLKIVNSTLSLEIRGINGSIADLQEGRIKYLNLADIGFKGEIINSTATLHLIGINTSLSLNNVTITSLYVSRSNITIRNSTVVRLSLESSNVSAFSSNMTILLMVTNTTEISDLEPKEYTDNLMVGDSRLYLQSTYVRCWSLIMENAIVKLIDSKISSIDAKNSQLSATSLEILFLRAFQSVIVMENVTKVLRVYISNSSTLNISDSKMMNIELYDSSNGTVNSSEIIVLHLEDSQANISSSRIESIYTIGSSNISVYNSTIVEAKITGGSYLLMDRCRSAVVDIEDKSQITVKKTQILYWLRVYDQASIVALDSTIWFGLVYKYEEVLIRGLESGNISHMVLSIDNGWTIELTNVYVLNWDVIAYSSIITVEYSQLGWIMLFYDSGLEMRYSQAILLRATHSSLVNIEMSTINAVYASGKSRMNADRSYIGMIYILGEANVYLSNVVFDIVAGMGSSAEAEISSSYGGVVAGISGIRIHISNSVATVYMAITEEDLVLRDLAPQYISAWSSETLGIEGDWQIGIVDSHISWALDLSLGSFTIEDSLLSQLFISNATATIRNTLVSDLMGVYGSKLKVYSSKLSSITIIWGSEATFYETTALYAYIIESNTTMVESTVNIVLGFLEGNYELKLRPGYYENTSIDQFINASSPIKLRLLNTSVVGWYVVGLGISGHVGLRIVDSQIISAGIAYNGTLIIDHSEIYGYSQVYLQRGMNTSLIMNNSATRLYLILSRIEETVNVSNVGSFEPITTEITKSIKIINTTVIEASIEVSSTDINIWSSKVDELRLRGSEASIENSKVESILATGTKLSIASSNIRTAQLISCETTISDTRIENLMLYSTEFLIENSEVGLSLYAAFIDLTVSGLQPISIDTAEVPRDLPLLAEGLIVNTDIVKWHIIVGEFAEINISDSQISRIDMTSYTSSISIKNSIVASLHMGYGGRINISYSYVGIDFDIVSLGLAIRNLRQGWSQHLITEDITGGKAPWNISIVSSRITMLNVTIHGAFVNLENINASIVLVNASSEVSISNTDAISLLVGGPSNLDVFRSFIRLINPGYGTNLNIYNSTAGIVDTYIYGQVVLEGLSSVPKTCHSRQMGYSIYASSSKLVDWTILAAMFSNVTIMNSHIFALGTDGFAKIYLIDTMFEYPIYAEFLSEIHILYTLTIEVTYDFAAPEKAKIEIIGWKTYELEAPKGKCSILLYHGIVREYERKDLGQYTIKAFVGGYSATKTIYLWKTLRVKIEIYGPLSISIFVAIIALVAIGIWKLVRKRIQKSRQTEETYVYSPDK